MAALGLEKIGRERPSREKLSLSVSLFLPFFIGGFAKNDSKLDFEYKSVPQIQSNAKVTQKPSEITTALL